MAEPVLEEDDDGDVDPGPEAPVVRLPGAESAAERKSGRAGPTPFLWQRPPAPEPEVERPPARSPGEHGPPPPWPKRVRLSTQNDVARQLRAIFRQVASGQLSATEGRRQAAILKSLTEVMVAHEVERRLGAIERNLKASGRGR